MAIDIIPGAGLDGRVNLKSLIKTCAALSAFLGLTAAAAPDGWQVIDVDRGITVSRREQPGAGIPSFRGQGVLNGNVLQMVSLLEDPTTTKRWACGVDETKVLSRKDARVDYIYVYSDLPWPVRDRDMVVRRTMVVVEPGKTFRMELHCESGHTPERDGVVRVKQCDSSFTMTKSDLTHTHFDYVMSLDPAGVLPKWAGSYVAKHAPFRTLVSIERETNATTESHHYTAAVKRWSAAM